MVSILIPLGFSAILSLWLAQFESHVTGILVVGDPFGICGLCRLCLFFVEGVGGIGPITC